MPKLLRVIFAAAAMYTAAGLLLVVMNGFSLQLPVTRRHVPADCFNQNEPINVGQRWECADTSDIRYGYYKTWPQWRFMSDYRGDDLVHYLPFDLLVSAALFSILAVKYRNDILPPVIRRPQKNR